MPTQTATVCKDCDRRAVLGTNYCATHTLNNQHTEHKTLFDQWRSDDPIRKLYRAKRWIHGTRFAVLRRDVLCVCCGHRTATDCDHVQSAREIVQQYGVDEFYNPDRCQGLCHSCHSSKTATQDSNFAGAHT